LFQVDLKNLKYKGVNLEIKDADISFVRD